MLFSIHIDQYLTFTYHITKIYKTASSQACLSSLLDPESKFMIFNAFTVLNILCC